MVKSFVAFSHGNFKGIKELLAKEPQLINASWDWINGDWETGLGAASHVGNRDIAEFLLDKGARINVFAMTMLGHTDMVKIILKTYPKTHAVRGPHGIPLLSHAIYGREQAADVFALLLENGVDVNQASNAGQTPLMAAASLGRVEVLQPLLDHKADPNLTDKKGRTALEYARGRKREKAATILEKVTKSKTN
jgi:ankyrin repeat protein